MRREPLSEKELERFTRRLALQTKLAQRASRKHKSWIDRLITRLLDRAMRPRSPKDDFMRDPIVDADIGFTVRELEAYQSGDGSDERRH